MPATICGDGYCEDGETALSCPADCRTGAVCGDGVCNGSENRASCATDCPIDPFCGDGVCNGAENLANCAEDCGASPSCGDGSCNGSETCSSCARDCGACGPRCGDGRCNGTETTATCPADCPCVGTTATTEDSCTGENLCVNGACVSAFGRNYDICIWDGVMRTRSADGATWDAAGGLPDPRVHVSLNGRRIGSTSERRDTIMPDWSECFRAVIPAGSSFGLEVVDVDIASDDLMFSCTNDRLQADLLRGGLIRCASSAGSPAGAGSHITLSFVRR